MSQWNQYRLIDILTQIDMTTLDDIDIEADLENAEIIAAKEKWSKKKIALVTSIAAGSAAVLTGAVVLLCRKNLFVKRAA